MSKRKNFQAKRRQIRRALNKVGDALSQMGTRKAARMCYGRAFSNSEASSIARGARQDNNPHFEVFY